MGSRAVRRDGTRTGRIGQRNGGSVLTRVPTAEERGGDLSDLGINIYNPCNGSDCNILPANRQQKET